LDVSSSSDCPKALYAAIAEILPQIQAIALAGSHPAQYQAAYKLLWHWSTALPYPQFFRAWQSKDKLDHF